MDMVRIGRTFRAIRIRRRWRQEDLASRSGVSAASLRRIEHGEGAAMTLQTLIDVGSALEIRLDLRPTWRGGDLDRMLNAGHAAMHEQMAVILDGLPAWQWAPEVSFAIYGERGVIDILAFHAGSGLLLIIELKTEIVDVGDLVGTMDRRRRLGRRIAAERGWEARSVSCWVVVRESATNRRRLDAHRGVLRHAFPVDGLAVRRWLRHPEREINGLSLLSNAESMSGKVKASLPKRVRAPRDGAGQP
jgi:transcriptional regulator with XRE-family HTH domain